MHHVFNSSVGIGCQRPQRIPSVLLVFLFLLVGVPAANAFQDDDKVSLQWKLKKGDVLELQFVQTQTVQTKIETRDRTLDTAMTLDADWKVIDVDGDGNANLEQTITRIRIKTGALGAPLKKIVDIDTDSAGRLQGVSRDLFKQIKTLVGTKFYLKMAPNGKLVEFRAGEEVNSVVAALPDTSAALKKAFGALALKKVIQQSILVLPTEPVASGDAWQDEGKVSLAGNDSRTYQIDRSTRSTLESVADGRANINVEIELKSPKNLSGDPDTSMTSAIGLENHAADGTVTFDLQRGIVRSARMTSEMTTRVVYRTDQVKTTVKTTNQLTVN